MQMTVEKMVQRVGQKDLEIMVLEEQVRALQQKIREDSRKDDNKGQGKS